ncbi:MAG: serine aminopeptidase domain-containing protein [Candidatus Eiseniibacteriota bacterium]
MPDRAALLEECTFAEGPGVDDYLYTRVYLPAAETRSTGVVIAPPVGHERLRCYRELVGLGRGLAEAGYPAIHLDYRGEGESSGDFADSDLGSRVADVGAAARELRGRARLEELVLVGVRLGALVALLAARSLAVTRVVLCEPVCDPRSHATDLLRANIILQRQYRGGIADTSPALRTALASGRTISVYGFHLGRKLLGELETLDTTAVVEGFAGEALVVYFAREERPPRPDLEAWTRRFVGASSPVEAARVVTDFGWAGKATWNSRLEPLNARVTEWLARS